MQNTNHPAWCLHTTDHPAPDPIPIRPRLHRQTLNVRKLRTRKTRTSGSRNVLPRLLTRIRDMWLMDLREPTEWGIVESPRTRGTRKADSRQNDSKRSQGRWPEGECCDRPALAR